MKKIIISSVLGLSALSLYADALTSMPLNYAPAMEAESNNGTLEYGYCGEMTTTIGWSSVSSVMLRGAIEIPGDVSQRFKGAKITKVRVGIGEGSFSESSIFISQGIEDEEFIYEQEVDFVPVAWNEIAFTEPYELDGDPFFVGYQSTAVSTSGVGVYPFGVSEEISNPYGDYIATFDGESWESMHLGDANLGNVCIKLILEGDCLPQYDLQLQSITLKEYVRTGDEFSIKGVIKNCGIMPVDFYDVEYRIGDSDPVTVTLDTRLEPTAAESFSIDGLKVDADGEYEVKVTITDLDGHADEWGDDNTQTATVNALSNMAEKKVLLENFSTAACTNCPRVHEMVENALKNRDNVAWVVHHTGYNSDTYTIDASREYLAFYPSAGTFAPAIMLDRTNLRELGANASSYGSDTPIFLPTTQEDLESYIDYCLGQPTFVNIKIEDAYDKETRELSVKVSGQTAMEFEQSTYMNVFLAESGMVNYQAGGGNNYVHNHAIRATMSEIWGDEIVYNEDGTYEKTYTMTLNNAWKPENMDIVAFITYFVKDVNGCTVQNTEFKKLNYDGAGVDNIDNNSMSVWTSGNTIFINGNYKHAEVYTIDGQLVKKSENDESFNVDRTGLLLVVVDGKAFKVAIK